MRTHTKRMFSTSETVYTTHKHAHTHTPTHIHTPTHTYTHTCRHIYVNTNIPV